MLSETGSELAARASPSAHLLDVTRLLSRAGRGPLTGIDRVEMAYLNALLAREECPAFALARAAPGHILLDRAGMAGLRSRLAGEAPWGHADWIARLHLRQSPVRRQAMSDLRRLAVGRALDAGLPDLLKRQLPPGTRYLNTGHSNLTQVMMQAMRAVDGGQIEVFVHDTIPLDHPEFSRAGMPESFAARLRLVGREADLVIYNSQVTRRAAERHFARWGRVPPGQVAHLGTDVPRPDCAALTPVWPAALARGRPYFLALGTIEPRKNHALLLDIWEGFADRLAEEEIPALLIVGARGWRNTDLLARLDNSPLLGRHLFELSGLGDGAVMALIQGARALLFPTHAEGFGLPAIEAAALGTPVICNDLEVFHEILGQYPVYASVTDRYLWSAKIQALTGHDRTKAKQAGSRAAPANLPSWGAHFHRVLNVPCHEQAVSRREGRGPN